MNSTAARPQDPDARPKMQRVIRCTKTMRYLAKDAWSLLPQEALVFDSDIDAVRECVKRGQHGVELVLRDPVTHVEIFTTGIR